ncbi:MAG: phosphatase PAP2-related protein [Vulcanimicrobiota bacterium]
MISTILIRLILVAGLIVLWFATQKIIGAKGLPDDGTIGDKIHDWMAPLHQKLRANRSWSRVLLITSSLGIDLLGLCVLYLGIFGESFAPIVGLFLILILRQGSQYLTSLPAPEGMIWDDPGVPSLFVTYHVANDLFFSGHTALAVYGALVLASLGSLPLTIAAVVLGLYEIFAVLALRAHWTMDVYAGAVSAILCFLVTQ